MAPKDPILGVTETYNSDPNPKKVNLGVGIPTMCSNTDIGETDIVYHSENGVIGYGPVAAPGTEDLCLVNAGGQNVTLKPNASVVHHADSFAIIRGGHIDVTVMGAYQVSMGGDFANWKLKGLGRLINQAVLAVDISSLAVEQINEQGDQAQRDREPCGGASGPTEWEKGEEKRTDPNQYGDQQRSCAPTGVDPQD